MANYVLLHGGAMGGWAWRPVAAQLQEQGHAVFTPTLTGLGERSHLATREVGISTHVKDIVNVFHYEDLREAILVGHSYAGAVIPGVYAALPHRIGRVILLDGVLLTSGESVAVAMRYADPESAARMAEMLRSGKGPIGCGARTRHLQTHQASPYAIAGERERWWLERLSDMPLSCLVDPAATGAGAIRCPVDYIASSADVAAAMHERAAQLGWNVVHANGDHMVHVGDPAQISALLVQLSNGRTGNGALK